MAERKIKTTLALDGEKQFKASMDEAYRGMKVLGSEMKLNTAIFGDNASSMEGLTNKGQILGKSIAQQKEIVEALSKAVEESAAAYGESDKKTDAYRIKLNNATAALSNMEGELDANETAIDNFGKGTQDADGKTNKWGESLKKVAETLGKGLVIAAKAAAAAVAAVAVAAGAAAIKLGKEVVKSFGELEQNLGGADAVFGEYAESIKKHGEDAYKNLGASQSDYLATANKMGALFQGSGIAQEKSLDLTVNAMQRAADMASVMGIDTQVALDSIAGAAKGNFTMMDNLGVAMNATNIEAYALAKGLDFTWKSATQAQKAEVAMQMFFENTQQYAGNFAKESEQTISGSIGMMKAATSSFMAGLGNADADMKILTQNMVTSFQAVVTNITPILQNIVTALPAVVATLAESLAAMLPMFIETLTGLFTQVLDTIVGLLPTLIPVVMEGLQVVISALMAHLPELTAVAVMMLSQFTQFIISNLPMLIGAATDMIVTLVDGITAAIPTLIPAALDGIMTFAMAILDNLPKIIKAGLEMLLALAKGIIDSIPKMVQQLPKLITAFIDFIVNNLPAIIEMGIKLLLALAEGLIKAIPQLLLSLPQIITAIVGGLLNGLGQIAQVGVNLVKGLWDGIKSSTQWLWDKLTGWIGDALGWLGNLLGIHSPSRVMADMIGKPMVQGLAKGISDNAGLVDDAMSDLMPDTGMVLDVTRRFHNVASSGFDSGTQTHVVSLDERALDRLANKIAAAVQREGTVITLNDREFGRAVRKAVPVF